MLGDARAVMDMRDDNGPLTVEWPAGLLRRALLSVGTRLAATGRIADAEHALELTPAEARVIMRTGTPTAADLSERATKHARQARLTPPLVLGPEEPAPPLDVLPLNLAQMVAMVQTALGAWGCSASGSSIRCPAPASAPRPTGGGCASPRHQSRPSTPSSRVMCSSSGPRRQHSTPCCRWPDAVVTAEGGPLSHAAVLARELGIPAVVGASGALDLQDGALVEVDPRVGAVRVLTG